MSLIKNILLKNYINDIYEASDGFFLSVADEIEFDNPKKMYPADKFRMADKYGIVENRDGLKYILHIKDIKPT